MLHPGPWGDFEKISKGKIFSRRDSRVVEDEFEKTSEQKSSSRRDSRVLAMILRTFWSKNLLQGRFQGTWGRRSGRPPCIAFETALLQEEKTMPSQPKGLRLWNKKSSPGEVSGSLKILRRCRSQNLVQERFQFPWSDFDMILKNKILSRRDSRILEDIWEDVEGVPGYLGRRSGRRQSTLLSIAFETALLQQDKTMPSQPECLWFWNKSLVLERLQGPCSDFENISKPKIFYRRDSRALEEIWDLEAKSLLWRGSRVPEKTLTRWRNKKSSPGEIPRSLKRFWKYFEAKHFLQKYFRSGRGALDGGNDVLCPISLSHGNPSIILTPLWNRHGMRVIRLVHFSISGPMSSISVVHVRA